MSETALEPITLAPGMVPIGWAEQQLQRYREADDPLVLWRTGSALGATAQLWNGYGAQKREIKAAQMFCEIALGQLLGPRPGWGNQHVSFPHAESTDVIPPQRQTELRRYLGHADALVEAVRNGALSRRALLLKVEEIEAGRRPEPVVGDLDIRGGDFRAVLDDIEPGSVALVLTDPPYPREHLPLWDALGAWSAEHLMGGGSLVAYCGQAIVLDAYARLSRHLNYWWTLALMHGQSQMIPGKWVSSGWKPILWYVRDGRRGRSMLADTVHGGMPRKTVPVGDGEDWAQAVDPLLPIISFLTEPGDLVVDPFAGSGTVGLAAHRFGRRFIGAELRA